MASQFKRSHFVEAGAAGRGRIARADVEREFWRLVLQADADAVPVEVEYGADLHTSMHGSGFPRGNDKYGRSGWNLNNLPVLDGSLLSYCSTEINGMIVPWAYLGMVFSSFAWHNEDHHCYSVSYLHFGEPKQWYGICGDDAPRFETIMRNAVPELFDEQPDLLFQLVTILSPAAVVRAGLPVSRATQEVGSGRVALIVYSMCMCVGGQFHCDVSSSVSRRLQLRFQLRGSRQCGAARLAAVRPFVRRAVRQAHKAARVCV